MLRLCLGLASLFVWSACASEPKPRPPRANDDCDGPGCNPAPAAGAGGQADAAVSTAPSDGAVNRDAADHDAGRNSATVVAVEAREGVDLETTATEPLTSLGDVYELTSGSAGWSKELVLASGVGSELSFTRDGAWFWFSQAPDSQWLSSIFWISEASSDVVVPLFTKQFFDDLGGGLGNFPVALDSAAGHAVVRVRDEQGRAVPSVSAEVPRGVIAYGTGGTASDFQVETGETGTIVWFNASTATSASLVLRYQAQTQTVELPVLPLSVTLVEVALNLQMP